VVAPASAAYNEGCRREGGEVTALVSQLVVEIYGVTVSVRALVGADCAAAGAVLAAHQFCRGWPWSCSRGGGAAGVGRSSRGSCRVAVADARCVINVWRAARCTHYPKTDGPGWSGAGRVGGRSGSEAKQWSCTHALALSACSRVYFVAGRRGVMQFSSTRRCFFTAVR